MTKCGSKNILLWDTLGGRVLLWDTLEGRVLLWDELCRKGLIMGCTDPTHLGFGYRADTEYSSDTSV